MTGPGGKTAVAEFLSGKLAQVDVLAIERELRKLWQEAARHESGQEGQDVARACMLNLILLTSGEAESSAGDILDGVMMQHPCRALLAIMLPSGQSLIEAWVSARCHLPVPGSTKQICCEQITIKSEGAGVNALPSVVLPLMVPDLPVFLWWHARGFDRTTLEPFLPALDRLIFDSLTWDADGGFFKEILLVAKGLKSRQGISDLNWNRLIAWRMALAQSFGALQTGLSASDLRLIDNVRLEFAPEGIGQAILFTGWLAAQLGWKPLSAKANGAVTVARFEAVGQMVRVEWVEKLTDIAPAGSLSGVEMSLSGPKTLSAQMRLIDEKPALVVCSRGVEPGREIICRGPDFDESRLAGLELDRTGTDPLLVKALKMAAHVYELLQAGIQ